MTQIENNVIEYGLDEVCDLITECMASNYKGIIFEKLKNKPKKTNKPSWMGKEYTENTATNEEIEEVLKTIGGEKNEI